VPVANRAVSDPTHFLALVVIRKMTATGAELVGQRLYRPLSLDNFYAQLRERKWEDMLDAACRQCQLPNRFHNPATTINFDPYPSGYEFASMIYTIELNGPVAELFNAMDEIEDNACSDVLDGVARLMRAIEMFDNAPIAAFVALTGKVRCLMIPDIIPLGQSELDVYEAQHPSAVAEPDQTKTS